MSEFFVSLDFLYVRILPLLLLAFISLSSFRSYTKALLFTCNRMMLVFGLAQLLLWYNLVNFLSKQPITENSYPVSGFQMLVIGLKFMQASFPLFTVSKRIAGSWLFALLYWLLLCWMPIYNSITIRQTGIRFEWIGEPGLWMAYIACFAVSYTVFWWMKVLPFQKKQDV
jgi:hypothetical protein